jgi:tRNA(fMet)-specific endonuclease VapC
MIVLDSDHLSVLKYEESPLCRRLLQRMDASPDRDFATTIVCVEEQMRGWLALIHRRKDALEQVRCYLELEALLRFFQKWRVLSFDRSSADRFDRLRRQRIRIGTQDLKIAAIVLEQDALLLSRNTVDFKRVPGLRVESWLD